MIRPALLAASLLLAAPALAEPVTRNCDFAPLGRLSISVDEVARRVVVTTPSGLTATFRDGVLGRLYGPDEGPDFGEVMQFVTIKPDRVEVGFRWPRDGLLGNWAYFSRAAFHNPAAPCVWRSHWSFRLA